MEAHQRRAVGAVAFAQQVPTAGRVANLAIEGQQALQLLGVVVAFAVRLYTVVRNSACWFSPSTVLLALLSSSRVSASSPTCCWPSGVSPSYRYWILICSCTVLLSRS